MNVSAFPGRTPPTPAPAEPAAKEAFCVIGGSDKGLIVGGTLCQVPQNVDYDTFFRGVVEHAFDEVSGFRFGVVLGNKSLA